MTSGMTHFAVSVIWVTSLGLPYVLFLVENRFSHRGITLFRAIAAIGAGWVFMIAYAIIANSLKILELSQDQGKIVFPEGDGAALAFVTVFGWILPLVVVCVAWLFHGWMIPNLRRKQQ